MFSSKRKIFCCKQEEQIFIFYFDLYPSTSTAPDGTLMQLCTLWLSSALLFLRAVSPKCLVLH